MYRSSSFSTPLSTLGMVSLSNFSHFSKLVVVSCCDFNLHWQWHPTPVLLPGKSHGWRSLVGCSPWGRWGSDTTEHLHFHFSLSCIREGNGNPLQCSCLENPRDGGAWWAAIYGVTQSRTRLKRRGSISSNDIEHLFVCIFSLCVCSLVKYLFKSFAHFLFGCFLITEFSEYFIKSVCTFLSYICIENSSLVYDLSFLYFKVFFLQHKFLIVVKSNLSKFSFMDHSF